MKRAYTDLQDVYGEETETNNYHSTMNLEMLKTQATFLNEKE